MTKGTPIKKGCTDHEPEQPRNRQMTVHFTSNGKNKQSLNTDNVGNYIDLHIFWEYQNFCMERRPFVWQSLTRADIFDHNLFCDEDWRCGKAVFANGDIREVVYLNDITARKLANRIVSEREQHED